MESTVHKTTLTRESPWPTAFKYIKVAVVLFALTALEVGAYEVVDEGTPAALAAALEPVLVAVLLVLSAAKFAMVGAFYMHLKQDSVFYSGLFVFPIAIAGVLVAALIALFSYTTSLY
ncbi:MAG: cytochrome C oxidase subunit IV family protein [Gemmatimonadales bacterium]